MFSSNEPIAAAHLGGMEGAAGFARVRLAALERLNSPDVNAARKSK
jgi:hypothetical protein